MGQNMYGKYHSHWAPPVTNPEPEVKVIDSPKVVSTPVVKEVKTVSKTIASKVDVSEETK